MVFLVEICFTPCRVDIIILYDFSYQGVSNVNSNLKIKCKDFNEIVYVFCHQLKQLKSVLHLKFHIRIHYAITNKN